MPRGVDHPPRIMRGNGYIDAAMKWPHEATILVRRPLENDMAKLPHLFERFYRVDTGRARRHGGSGLGLSICKSLVESHGGSISCQSIPGEGSTFIVRLPLAVFKSNDVFRVVEQEAP